MDKTNQAVPSLFRRSKLLIFPGFAIEVISRLASTLAEPILPSHAFVLEARIRARLLNLKYGFEASAIGRSVVFGKPLRVRIAKDVALHNGVVLMSGARGHITIGAGSHISHHSVIAGGAGVVIGQNCAISSGVAIYSVTNQRLAGQAMHESPLREALVNIGDDVLIGANAVILPGVSVGAGAIIGANSVVSKNIAADEVVVGVPARRIKRAQEAYDRV